MRIDCRIRKKLDFSAQISENYSNIQFHYNLTGEIRAVAIRKTGSVKKTLTLRNLANWPKIVSRISVVFSQIHMKQLTFTFNYKPRENFQINSK